MLISGPDAMLYFGENEALASAKHLAGGHNVFRAGSDFITWYHILFDRHEVIFTEGTATENYHPGCTRAKRN